MNISDSKVGKLWIVDGVIGTGATAAEFYAFDLFCRDNKYI